MSTAGKILLALVQFAPEVRDAVLRFWGAHVIDLGPVPPDLRQHAADVDAEIDRRLELADTERGRKGGG